MRISDWSSDVCSSDLTIDILRREQAAREQIAATALEAGRPVTLDHRAIACAVGRAQAIEQPVIEDRREHVERALIARRGAPAARLPGHHHRGLPFFPAMPANPCRCPMLRTAGSTADPSVGKGWVSTGNIMWSSVA